MEPLTAPPQVQPAPTALPSVEALKQQALDKLARGIKPSQFVGKKGGLHYKTLNMWLKDAKFSAKWYGALAPSVAVPKPPRSLPNYVVYCEADSGDWSVWSFDSLIRAQEMARSIAKERGRTARLFAARSDFLLKQVPTMTEEKVTVY